MEGPRSPRESEYSQVLEFLHSHLRPEAGWSLSQEYPTALGPTNLNNIRIITEQGKVLSHAVLKPLIIKTPIAILKAAAIGSVVTDSEHRGQGLSTKVLEECLAEARRQECDIAILWTNLHEFYRKLDFELAGTEISCTLENEFTTPAASGLKYIRGANVSAAAIYRLYSQHTVGSVRTAEDIQKFMNIPQSTVYTAWDQTGQLVAYAVDGKGADLTNYIHEWGGSTSKIIALLSHIRKEKAKPVTIIFPRQSTNLHRQLKELPGSVVTEGFLGMIKIINQAGLFAKIKKTARQNGLQDLILEKQGSHIVFGLPGDLLTISDEKDFVSLLFGPISEIPLTAAATSEKLLKLFPLPLWFWGWDSV